MCVINCENLSLGYNGKEIIKDLSFKVNKGDYLCIVGENGSGKTTLMKGLLGLIKPYGGKIEINENRIGYLPQQTTAQRDFPVTVKEVVLSGCLSGHKHNPFYTKKDKETCDAMLKKLELSDIKNKCYQEISGGQQQRVLIARALCAAGNLLILDEPAAGLDMAITNEIYDIISNLNKKDKMTVIIVSHDIEASLKYASHILHINHNLALFSTCGEYKLSLGKENATGGDLNG